MPALALSRAPAACLRSQRSGSSSAGRASASRSQGSALQAQRQTARRAAARRLCTASASEKEGTQQTEGQPKVPDTPPAPTGASQQQQEQAAARAQPVQEEMSIEEIQQRAAQMRQQRAAAGGGKEGLVEGVTEEVRLIKWPSPAKAALNTVLVIGIVAGTAGLLLAINGALTELSTVLY